MVLVGGVFERYLGHEKGVPINGISAVIKRSSRSLAIPLCEYEEKPRTRKRASSNHGGIVMSDFQLPEV